MTQPPTPDHATGGPDVHDEEPALLAGRPDDGTSEEPSGGFANAVLSAVKELVIIIVLALGLSFVVKTWLFQAFYIPSGSMEDTLVKDDRVIVSKLTPGPFDLRRGDVVVFEDPGTPQPWLAGLPVDTEQSTLQRVLTFVGLLPEDSENHLIKRVIGLPGDHIVADGGSGPLTVNGVPVTEPYVKEGDAPSEKPFDIVVPPGKVWVMGDHRSDSADSRYHDESGTGADGSVPMDKIVGRALFIVWPIDNVTWLGVPQSTFAKVPDPATLPKPGATNSAPVSPRT